MKIKKYGEDYFPAVLVNKDDMVQVIGTKKANSLTDADMERIAELMGEYLLADGAYWEGLEFIAERIELI